MRVSFCLFIMLLFLPCSAGAWTQNVTFEGGVGSSDGVGLAGSEFTQSSTRSFEGSFSAKVHFAAGDTCYDPSLTCGAFFETPSPIGNGGELWLRAYIYFPDEWDWGDQDGNGQWRKILRFNVPDRGRISVVGVWPMGADTTAEIAGGNEAGGSYAYEGQFTGVDLPIGRWFAVEQYVKLGTTDATSLHKIWLDGVLIFDNKDIATDTPFLADENGTISATMIFTYWNGRVRTTQDAWVDSVVITTDTPANVDAHGNRMIGPVGWSSARRLFRNVRIGEVEP